MKLKQWKILEKCRKLGSAGGFMFVRDNYLYVGNNYAAVRLNDADKLTGAAIDANAEIYIESYPKKTSDKVEISYGASVENLRTIDTIFTPNNDGVSRCVNPDYLKQMADVAKSFGWYVRISAVDTATYGEFVDRKYVIHGQFLIMGVRSA